MLSILSQDLYFRINNVLDKISTIKKYDKIETPKFLKGMYVPKEEKQEYEIIEKLINKFSDYSLINLTNAGLYSLYKDNNDEFHKMNVNWKWNNSYLYSDYIAKLNKQLLLNSNIILSSDNLIIDGYIPIKLFPAPYATDLAEKLVFLVPGKSKNAFQICYIDNSKKRSNPSINNNLNENIYHIKLKLKESIITINSIIVETFTEYNIPANIEKYEFEYNIIPRIFNKEDEKLLKNLYLLNINTKQYSIPELKDNNTIHRLMDIFSNIFLYENYFIIADTFKNSRNGKIIIYLNDKLLHNKNDLFELNGLKNNIIDLIIPVSGISKNYIIKLRINYNGDYYYEEIIKNPK